MRGSIQESPRPARRGSADSQTIDAKDLPPGKPDSPIDVEWDFYRANVEKLLAEGNEGRFILIKGDQVIGIWDTLKEAEDMANEKFLMQPCLIHQIRRREPIIKMSPRFWACQD